MLFCIGNPIVNVMNFGDFEEFSSFFQDKFYIGNSTVNFLISWQSENFLRKSRFLIDFLWKVVGFFPMN